MCSGEKCTAPDGPTRRVEFIVSGSTLSGHLAGQPVTSHTDGVGNIRLTRVR